MRFARRISDFRNRGERSGADAPCREKHGRGAGRIADDRSVMNGRDHSSRWLLKSNNIAAISLAQYAH